MKRVDVIRRFSSKVSRSTLQVRDVTVRLYRFSKSDKFKALVTAKFWLRNNLIACYESCETRVMVRSFY